MECICLHGKVMSMTFVIQQLLANSRICHQHDRIYDFIISVLHRCDDSNLSANGLLYGQNESFEENGVNPETYKMLELMEKTQLHHMNCGANYNQASCATCGNMTRRLSYGKRKIRFSFIFLFLLLHATKNIQNHLLSCNNCYRLKKSETAIVCICIYHHKDKSSQIVLLSH